jgi:hypothetical protein
MLAEMSVVGANPDLTDPQRHFRSTSNNGHREAGSACPKGAKLRHRGHKQRKRKAARRRLSFNPTSADPCIVQWNDDGDSGLMADTSWRFNNSKAMTWTL